MENIIIVQNYIYIHKVLIKYIQQRATDIVALLFLFNSYIRGQHLIVFLIINNRKIRLYFNYVRHFKGSLESV